MESASPAVDGGWIPVPGELCAYERINLAPEQIGLRLRRPARGFGCPGSRAFPICRSSTERNAAVGDERALPKKKNAMDDQVVVRESHRSAFLSIKALWE
jgi:hypothetical protein